jgi:hypothetical protein
MAADREDTLPSSNRIGTDNGMNRFELAANILWGATGLVVELESCLVRHLLKEGLLKGHRKPFEELLVRLADAVVDLIPRCPQGVYGGSSPSAFQLQWQVRGYAA